MSRPLRHLILWLLPLFLLGCSGEASYQWNAHDITGVMPDLQFHLTDDHGEEVTGDDYRGKITMMYFGYASCQHVCPVVLGKMATAVRGLGDDADKVQILFVSVDPKRDTTEVLHNYVKHFTPELVGLTGTQDQLHEVTKRYRVGYSYEEPNDNGFYVVNHSSAVFVFGPQGKTRLLIDSQETTDEITADLEHLIEQSTD